MIRAAARGPDGITTVFLGITPQNIDRLKGDQPILVDAEPFGLKARIVICFGQTERAIVADLRSHGIRVPDDAEDQVRAVEAEHRAKGTTP